MAGSNYGGAISAVGSAAADLLQGQATEEADQIKAQGDLAEAGQYKIAGQEAAVQGDVKLAQEQRALSFAQGQTESEIAAGGLAASGSALDIMRSNATQGALAAATIQQNTTGEIETSTIQEATANNAATSENKLGQQARDNSYISAGISAVAAIGNLIPV